MCLRRRMFVGSGHDVHWTQHLVGHLAWHRDAMPTDRPCLRFIHHPQPRHPYAVASSSRRACQSAKTSEVCTHPIRVFAAYSLTPSRAGFKTNGDGGLKDLQRLAPTSHPRTNPPIKPQIRLDPTPTSKSRMICCGLNIFSSASCRLFSKSKTVFTK